MGVKGFAEGGMAAVVAGSSTHPLDLIKVRMQLQGEKTTLISSNSKPHFEYHNLRPAFAFNHLTFTHHYPSPPPVPLPEMFSRGGPISVGLKIVRTEGIAGLFSGVSASILRQSVYSTTCLGIYDVLKHKWSDPESQHMPLMKKISSGIIAGGIGATVGNPADVAMVRMQADGRLPKAHRRNYKSVVDAITQIAKQEGVSTLWRGSSLTVNRAMVVAASQLATYDQIKETILAKGLIKDGILTHLAASLVAGFVAAVASNPLDVIKTRVMNMKVEHGVVPPYAGALDCAIKTVKSEGAMALYKGFVPTICRQGPYTVVLFVTLEQVRKVLKDF